MALKSSYELAMERLGKAGGPARTLTAEQKKQFAELDAVYKAKIAELEISIQDKLNAAREAGNAEEFFKLQQRLTDERQKLRQECETKKEKLRRAQ
jgi:hypothetical protein